MEVIITESGLFDLDKIKAWYEDHGMPDIGYRWEEELIQRTWSLVDNPYLGRVVESGYPDYRELVHPPYLIRYWIGPDMVAVVHFRRSGQQ